MSTVALCGGDPMPIQVRDATWADLPSMLALNNAAAPAVNELDNGRLSALFEQAALCRIALHGGTVAGFLLALREAADYESVNYRWFQQHYDRFVYIDRVVVAPASRGHGVGKILYADVESFAERRAPYLTCEVNVRPRNDISLIFHGTLGFEEVGHQATEGGSKLVCLMVKPLASFQDDEH